MKIKTVYLLTGKVLVTEYSKLTHLYWPLSRNFGIGSRGNYIYCSFGCSLDSCANSFISCNNCSYCINYQI